MGSWMDSRLGMLWSTLAVVCRTLGRVLCIDVPFAFDAVIGAADFQASRLGTIDESGEFRLRPLYRVLLAYFFLLRDILSSDRNRHSQVTDNQPPGRRQLFLPLATIVFAGLGPSSLVHHRSV